MIDASNWKEFKVKDVLKVEQTKSVVSKSDLVKGDIPYVTRTVSDNGYTRFCGNKDKINEGNCITIGAETGVAFYQPNDFVAGNKVYRLSREGLGEKEYLYLAGVLNKQTGNYSYSNARIPEKIKAEIIVLPVTPDGMPDWEYMEKYIAELEEERVAELEEERVAELEAYLKVCGLDDYKLNDSEKAALCVSDEKYIEEFVGDIVWKKVRIGDIFDIHPTKAYKLTNSDLFKVKGNTPVLCNSSNNNGIAGYIGLDPTEEGNIITFSDTTTGPNTLFYQAQPFVGYAHIQGMYPIGINLDEKIAEFIIPRLQKAVGDGFDYARKFTRTIVSDAEIELPFGSNGELLYVYIYIYTSYRKNSHQECSSLERPSAYDFAENSLRWGEFRIGDLFDIKKGKRLTKQDMTKGNTLFIGSTASNNGKTATIGQEPIFEGNCISVSYNGSVGEAFYQTEPFWASDDINVLYLKNHEQIT